MASSHAPASPDSHKKSAVPQLKLTEEHRGQLKEAFNLFDKDTCGRIDVRAIKVVIQALGYEPKKKEINRILAIVDKDGTGRMDFNAFLSMMEFKMAEPESYAEIKKSFWFYADRRTGIIMPDDVKRAGEELGEHLTDEEAKELILEAKPGKDLKVNRRLYLRMMKDAAV